MKILKTGTPECSEIFSLLKSRRYKAFFEYAPLVDAMILQYQKDREGALLNWNREFDEVDLGSSDSQLWVDEKAIKNAHKNIPSDIRKAIDHAIQRIERFQQEMKLNPFQTQEEAGVFWGTEVRPLDRVGIYVPGGRANYFSTLLLSAVPARTAGVKELIVATAPRKKIGEPWVEASLLYVCKLFDISKVLLAGSVGALSALAFGTKRTEPVQKIVGSGSKRTSIAKMRLAGVVGSDGLMGPSETAFICDKTTDIAAIAADIVGRADRDSEAEIFVFQSESGWIERLVDELAKRMENIKDASARTAIQSCLEKNLHCFVTKNIEDSIHHANELSPGVVCLNVKDPSKVMDRVGCCGILLMGPYTPPVSLDLIGGPSGLVPTLGTAAYSISMSPSHFMRRFPVVEFEQSALERFQREAVDISEEEGFSTHEASYRTRLSDR